MPFGINLRLPCDILPQGAEGAVERAGRRPRTRFFPWYIKNFIVLITGGWAVSALHTPYSLPRW